MGFLDRGNAQAFYTLIDDRVALMPDITFGWNSSNLFERLNYAYCSVPTSFLIYFAFIFTLLLLEKKLGDLRYFYVAFITIVLAFEGYNYYNLPQVVALCLLFLSSLWRLGRAALADGARAGRSTDPAT